MYSLQPLPVKVIVVRFAVRLGRRRRGFSCRLCDFDRCRWRGFHRRTGGSRDRCPNCTAHDQQQQHAAEFQDERRHDAETLPHAPNVEAEQLGDGRHLQRRIGNLVETGIAIQLCEQLRPLLALALPLYGRRALDIEASHSRAERPARRLCHVRAGLAR